MRQTFKYIVQDDLVTAMEAVRVPCLLVWGEFDVTVPLDWQKDAEVIPKAQLKVIPRGSRRPFKNPNLFTSYIVDFA